MFHIASRCGKFTNPILLTRSITSGVKLVENEHVFDELAGQVQVDHLYIIQSKMGTCLMSKNGNAIM